MNNTALRAEVRSTSQSYGLNYQKTGKDMPYLFVKSWLPNKNKRNRDTISRQFS